ncbi:SAM-dependent methyltransferase [Micromonospora sp. NBC_01699]|uniref:SAM-dependent methyltransferase n=1 Tax=Micromonospora sp. NBC_01699 TaxID=2975984 RepID=UPI002E3034FE|nr:SAM-dependent methyltransferase [Micromonospora sp. NBC_01699]
MSDQPGPASRLDTTVAHPARRYNYWLGGKDNFAADRLSGDQVAAAFPTVKQAARENRAFLQRAVGFLAGEAGIRQFLDIGTGLPTADNTHEVAQRIAPRSRIVYADNDPLVMAHARALLTSSPEGRTAYLERDLRDPGSILDDEQLHATLDLGQPVGLMLVAILHFVRDFEDPYGVVGRLVESLPSGSYLAMSHGTYDGLPAAAVERLEQANAATGGLSRPRSRDELARFFTGLDLVDPGIVPVGDWRPAPDADRPDPVDICMYGAVARIP